MRRRKLVVGMQVRVAIPSLERLGPDQLVMMSPMREEVGTILRFYKAGMQTGPTIVDFQMADRIVVGLDQWIAGLAEQPAQMDLFS